MICDECDNDAQPGRATCLACDAASAALAAASEACPEWWDIMPPLNLGKAGPVMWRRKLGGWAHGWYDSDGWTISRSGVNMTIDPERLILDLGDPRGMALALDWLTASAARIAGDSEACQAMGRAMLSATTAEDRAWVAAACRDRVLQSTEATPTTQPAPRTGNARDTIDLVVDELLARKAFGKKKYGVAHQHDNGRDHLRDALDEALDLCVCLTAAIAQRDAP